MAANSFGLFVQQISAADDELKVTVIRIIYDLLMVHDIETLVSGTLPVGPPHQVCYLRPETDVKS
jgi:condensin complex subunit 3